MVVKIRLTRTGRKKLPSYRVVVADSRMPRDGRFIEMIGFYDPKQDPSVIDIDKEKAKSWLDKGAQPSNTVGKLLEIVGVLEPKAKKPAPRVTTSKTTSKDEAKTKKQTLEEEPSAKVESEEEVVE